MLKIRKDNIEKIVTIGCFENLYKDMGYEIVNESKNATVENTVAEARIEEVKQEENINNNSEKPKNNFNYNNKKKK